MPTTAVDVNSSLIEELCLLVTEAEQSAFLQTAGLLNEAGLLRLLDTGIELARTDPGKVRRLTTLCTNLADEAAAPLVVPRAAYLLAQTYAMSGDFELALELIKSARDSYLFLEQTLPALRTNVGLMHVFNELGRHQEALDVGQATLDTLQSPWFSDDPAAQQITTFVHHNRGVCYRLMGRYDEALAAYAVAEKGYLAGGMTQRLADIRNNRGIILLHLGRTTEALSVFESAAALLADAGHTLLYAQSLINIGDAHLLLGNYTRSLDALARARRLLDSLDVQAEKDVLLLDTADVYLALNLYPEALLAYREADDCFQTTGRLHHRGRALWGMGASLTAQARYEEAEQPLAEAAALFQAAANVPMQASVMLEQAALQMARGEQVRAVQLAEQALELVVDGWPVQAIYAHLRLADLWSANERLAEQVEHHLVAAATLLVSVVLPHLNYRLLQRLGQLRRRQGRPAEARDLLETAVSEIERTRGRLAQEAIRVSFLHDKMAAYEELLQLHLDHGGEGAVSEAFAVAEQAKSRALVDLLTGVIEPPGALPADPRLAAELQALQADLNAIYNEFLGQPDEKKPVTDHIERQAQARALERKIRQIRLQADPATRPDPFAASLSLDAVRSQIPAELMLLAYHTIGDEIVAFVHAGGRIHLIRRLSRVSTVKTLLQRLNVQWDRFRTGRAFAERHMARLEESTRRVLADLHQALFAPLSPFLAPDVAGEVGKLAIIPHGLLHQVPFHALFDGRQYVLQQYEISYAPSATVLALCQGAANPGRKKLVAAVSDPMIPAVSVESQALAQELPDATMLLDQQATLAAVKAAVGGCSLVHLACHGLFRADNPMFSALRLHDGWLTAADILQLDLRGALVTLSACESGRSQVLAGDEVVGLTRAFLGAGAATLVVTLWLVQDETTATLMADWYRQLQKQAGVGRAAALRLAQLALKEQYPHPYYWAPFVLVGQRS